MAASAFLDVWDRRAKLESPEHLGSLLHQAVTGEATHEVRRRAAAHHMAGNGKAHEAPRAAAESVDQWWAKVVGVLHAAHADQAEVAKQRAEHSRHEAAEHMKKVAQPKRTGRFVLAIIVLALMAGVPLWYFNKGAETAKAGQLLGRDDTHVAHSKEGQRGTFTLEDSTVVHMGSATILKYTKSFPLDAHALQLNGTAVFTVPKSSSPLLLKVGNAWVWASDAEFLARSYADDSGAVRGVRVQLGRRQLYRHAPAAAQGALGDQEVVRIGHRAQGLVVPRPSGVDEGFARLGEVGHLGA